MEGLPLPDHLLLKNISITSTDEGKYSTVYLNCNFKCAGRTLLTKELKKKDTFLDDFVQEIKLHSQQVHPNIVQLLGIHCTSETLIDNPLLITEYLPSTITQFLNKHPNIPHWIKTQFMLDISRGLSYLHSHDPPIIHYGLTSDTIFLTEHFQAKITDLSISRLTFNNNNDILTNSLDFDTILNSNTLESTINPLQSPNITFDLPAAVNASQSPTHSPLLPTINSPALPDNSIESFLSTNTNGTCDIESLATTLRLTSSQTTTDVSNYIYMPPEFYDTTNTHTNKFDIFSFGCIAVHILSQQYPIPSQQFDFSSENFVNTEKELTDSVLTNELSFVSEWSKRRSYLTFLPSNHSLVVLTEKCLSNDIHDRPTALDIVTTLEKEEHPYSFTDGGILTLISELQNKEKQIQNGALIFKRKTKDYQAVLDAKELTSVRLRNLIQNKDKKLAEEKDWVCTLKEENVQLKATNTQLQGTIDELQKRITEFEKEDKVQRAVTLALENVKQEQAEQLTKLRHTLEELSEKNKTLQNQLDSEMKEKIESTQTLDQESAKLQELEQQMAVMKESESRMESIMYNQRAQLEGLQQTINSTKTAQNSLQKNAMELQFLQASLLDEQAELTDKYQCDVTALRECIEFNQLKLQIQKLEHEKLLKENVSLKSSLYDAKINLKDQQQILNQLLARQENQLSIVGAIKVTPPLFQQKRIMESLLKQKYIEGDFWCLVSMNWFKTWEKYLTTAMRDGIENSISPGPVTNFMLMKSEDFKQTGLKDQLIKDLEYKLIPEIGWDLLIQWYGLSEKSLRIARQVVKVKKNTITMFQVEIYPLTVQAILASTNETLDQYQISRKDKIASIMIKLKQHFKVPDDVQVRLWARNTYSKVLLKETDTIGANIQSFTVKNHNTLILDTKDNDTWKISEDPINEKYYYVHVRKHHASVKIRTPSVDSGEYEDMT